MALALRRFGRGQRLVLAHGFTQNARCWGPFAADLGADHEVVAVDLPGHGITPAVYDGADLPEVGRLLAETGDSSVYVGYSMGGRVALHTALDHPGAVRGLVLIGATAGIDDAADRAARRDIDEAQAQWLLDVGLEAFLERWLANPLFDGLSAEAQGREARLDNRIEGLAASLRNCGTGTQQPLWGRLDEIRVPVLVIAGEDDPKFLALGERLVAGLPDAVLRTAPSSHAAHLARPTTVAGLVRDFVTERIAGP